MVIFFNGNKKPLFIILGFLVLINVVVFGYLFWSRKQEKDLSSQETSLPAANFQDLTKFFIPIERDKLEESKLVQMDYGFNDLGFRLKDEGVVYAAFSGQVNLAGERTSAQKIIFLQSSKDPRLGWKYLFSGDFLVEEGGLIEEGTPLARVRGLLPTRGVNLVVQSYENGARKSFSEIDLEKIVSN